MTQYTFLTGRKDLFDNAPDSAMVVLEHEDGRLFFAVAHVRGASYWNEDGSAGSKIGLVALHTKTRVIASRVLTSGVAAAPPVPSSPRGARMLQAQSQLTKAVKAQSARPADKQPSLKAVDDGAGLGNMVLGCAKCGTTGIHACTGAPGAAWTEQDKHRLADAARQVAAAEQTGGGFVSMFELSKRSGPTAGTFLTLNRNGNIAFSSALLTVGDLVDVQIDQVAGLIRVGKVTTGGRKLPKARMLTSSAALRLFKIPEGKKSLRVYLTEVDGWWQGKAEFAPEVKP